ncbi:histidine phosphatase family protein [Variovorax sp. J22R133]|uniref:histidine phosphatase family protein n=1 Tax=Variovorax brevis TaxID=3053503 RepID=UPI002575C47F|nr:histidine phosphatase family protein [Variovorax sp. J22R133]MDM0112773.1 histidine phosphatase family protein [Variovorax sp. J22R133]
MAPGLQEILRLCAAHPLAPACDHFYFLRHGQTARNALKIFQAPDEPLNETGMEQARRAAQLLAGEPIRTIVCSDAQRAFDTAHTVAAPLGLVPTATETLRERNFGVLIGTSSADIDWACDPENGESLEVFVARKRAALEAALAQPGPVLVVAHGGSLYVLAALLGVPADLTVLGNAQPLRFERHGPNWVIRPLLQQEVDGAAAIA